LVEDMMDESIDVYFSGRNGASNEAWWGDRVVMPAVEEIRYAERPRLQIIAAHPREAASPAAVFWSIGVD
jgi:hypothetical protein